MVRSILAVIVGLVVAVITFMGFETLSWFIYMWPLGIDVSNEKAVTAFMETGPVGPLLVVLLGYFVGTLCGIALSVRIARRAPVVHALIVCGVVMLSNLVNLRSMSHPTWFWYTSFATFPVAAAAGVLIGRPPAKLLAA